MAEPKIDAFFAFRKREQKLVLTRATIAYFIIYLAISAIYLALTWSYWGALVAWYLETIGTVTSGGEPSAPPREVLALAPYGLVVGVLSLIVLAAYEAACLRWLIRGEAGGGLMGLRFGADTWRVFCVYLLWIVFGIVFVVALVLFYVALNMLGGPGGAMRMVAILIGALAPLGLIALLIWLSTRLAPAAATSVARGKIAFFGAWGVTHGRFWPLLGAFVIVCVGYFVIATIVSNILQIPMTQATAPLMRDVMSGADGAQLASRIQALISALTSIAYVAASLAISPIMSMLFYIALFGVNASAVRAAQADEATAAGSAPA